MVSLVGVEGAVAGFKKNHHISPIIKITTTAAPAKRIIRPFFFVLEPEIAGKVGSGGGAPGGPVRGGVVGLGKLADGKFIGALPVIGDSGVVAGRAGIGGTLGLGGTGVRLGRGGRGGKGGKDGGGLIGRGGSGGAGGRFCAVRGPVFNGVCGVSGSIF